MNVVFDSNILVSAFLVKRGLAYELLTMAREGKFDAYLSREILEETQQVLLTYERIRTRYHYSDEDVMTFIQGLWLAVHRVNELPHVKLSRDPKDDMVIATVIKANADYLVSRDKDLLVLKTFEHQGKILSPEDFKKNIIIRIEIAGESHEIYS